MRGLFAVATVVLFLVASVESYSLKRDFKVPDARAALKTYFETKKHHTISRNKRQNSECEAVHLEASGPKYGDCQQVFYMDIGFQEVSDDDIADFCVTNGCSDYLYKIDEELIEKCPDDPGVSRSNHK